MKRLIPDSITSRTLLVLIIGLTLSHALSIALYFTDRNSALLFTGGEHIGERIAIIDRIVATASPEERQRILELADNAKLQVFWSQNSAIGQDEDEGWKTGILRSALVDHIGNGAQRTFNIRFGATVMPDAWQDYLYEHHPGSDAQEILLVSLHVADGGWLNFAVPIESPEPFWSVRFAISLAVMLLAVGALSGLVVRHLTKPLATFARAAQRLGVDVKAPPMPEIGPSEVKQATKAFNEMQDRIQRFVQDRTQMIAAISHDLGTPITRLRLRAELVDDQEQRHKMLSDLRDMEGMVFSTLSFARDEASCEPYTMVDLRSLLQRICDDMADAGHDATFEAAKDAVPLGCRPAALRRALSNIVENAVKYGLRARISIEETMDSVLVHVDDDGPGVPMELQAEVFKPFRRLESSRNRETGGTGLGLTVARTIVRAHGGDITFTNRSEGGLRVSIRMPRQ